MLTKEEVFTTNVVNKPAWTLSMAFIEKTGCVYIGSSNAKIECWKVVDKKLEFKESLGVPGDVPRKMCAVNYNKAFLVATLADKMYAIDLNTGNYAAVPTNTFSSCITLEVSKEKRRIYGCNYDPGEVNIFKY